MKAICLALLLLYGTASALPTQKPKPKRRPAEQHYHVGPRGGCYYFSKGGKKVYIDHSYCR